MINWDISKPQEFETTDKLLISDIKPTGEIKFFGDSNTEVLRISKEGIWTNPDLSVDDVAKEVLKVIDNNIKIMVQKAVMDEQNRCVDIIETYRIPVGNSAAGEMACEWTYDALKDIRDEIRNPGKNDD